LRVAIVACEPALSVGFEVEIDDALVEGGVIEVMFPQLSHFIARIPTTALALGASGLVEFVAFLARAVNASKVLPVFGALITATSPV
jgi:hypothetical protein